MKDVNHDFLTPFIEDLIVHEGSSVFQVLIKIKFLFLCDDIFQKGKINIIQG